MVTTSLTKCVHPPCRQVADEESGDGFCCGACRLWALNDGRPVPAHDEGCIARTLEARTGAPMYVRAGDEARCRVCGRWHVIVAGAADDKPDVDRMRYVMCPKACGYLYVGREGEVYRSEFGRRVALTSDKRSHREA